MLTVVKTFYFEGAHKLPFHGGLCKNLHGHSFKLEIGIRGHIKQAIAGNSDDSELGMIIDFSKLISIVNEEVISKLDHTYLNDCLENPTAENLIMWIAYCLAPIFEREGIFLQLVRLWETKDSHIEWIA